MLIVPMDDESGHLNVNDANIAKAVENLIFLEDEVSEESSDGELLTTCKHVAAPRPQAGQHDEKEEEDFSDNDCSSSSEEELEPLVPEDDYSDEESVSDSESDSDSDSCSSNNSDSVESDSDDDEPPATKRTPFKQSDKVKFERRKSIENTRHEEDEGPAYRWDEGNSRKSPRDQVIPMYRWNDHPIVEEQQTQTRQKCKLRRSTSMEPLGHKPLDRSISMRMPIRSTSLDLDDETPSKKRNSLPYTMKGGKIGGCKERPDYRWDKGGGSKGGDKRGKMPMRTKSDLTGYVDVEDSLVVLGKVKICLASTVFFEVPKATKEMKGDLYYSKNEIKAFRAANSRRKQEQSAARLRARMEKANGKTGGRFPKQPAAPVMTC